MYQTDIAQTHCVSRGGYAPTMCLKLTSEHLESELVGMRLGCWNRNFQLLSWKREERRAPNTTNFTLLKFQRYV